MVKGKWTRRRGAFGNRKYKPFGARTRSKLNTVYKAVKTIMPELKFLDNFIELGDLSNNATSVGDADDYKYEYDATDDLHTGVIRVCRISQGDGESNRDGASARLRYVSSRWQVKLDPTATSGGLLRHMFVKDTDPDGTAPSINDILDNKTTGNVPQIDAMKLLSGGTRKRFQILSDRTYKLNTESGGNDSLLIKHSRKLPLSRTMYDTNNRGKSGPDYFYVVYHNKPVDKVAVGHTIRTRFYA